MRRALVVGAMAVAMAALAAEPQRDRHVVIVSLDGFPASALSNPDLPLPNLRKLAAEGAVAAAMRPVNPTVTWPNHTSIVTGVGPERHTVVYNGWAVRQGEGSRSPSSRMFRRMTWSALRRSTTRHMARG